MTQDCLDSPSTADVSRMPWGYLFFHNKTAQAFEKEMKDRNDQKQFYYSLFHYS